MMNGSFLPTLCRICGENCGIRVKEEPGGRVTIAGNPDHPISRGFLCFKAKRYGSVHTSAERLRHPLLRTKAGWKRIAFDDAMDILVSRLLQHRHTDGAQSVVFYKGEALKHQENTEYLRHLAFSFGTPNFMTVSSVCHAALDMGYRLAGAYLGEPDLTTVRSIIVWGANPFATHPLLFRRMLNARSEGSILIGIDPSVTPTTRISDIHLQVRPGSDGFLALAFLARALEKGWIPRDSNAFLPWNVLSQKSAAFWLDQTEIPIGRFEAACDVLFRNLPSWIYPGVGLEQHPCGVSTIRAIAWLQRVLHPSGAIPSTAAHLRRLPQSDNYPQMPAPIGSRQAPFFVGFKQEGHALFLKDAVLHADPYPVKAMVIAGGNPLLTFPDTESQKRVLAGLSFLAVFDLFATPTAQMADLILPAADFLETTELHDYGPSGHSLLGIVRPVVRQKGGIPAWSLIFELARRLGLEDRFPWKDNLEAMAYRLDGSGVRMTDLMSSPTSTVVYESFDESLPQHIHSNLSIPPFHESDLKLPVDTWQDQIFWLSSGNRNIRYLHSQFRNIPAHTGKHAQPVVLMHPKASERLGIHSGNRVRIQTPAGILEVQVELSNGLRPDSLCMIHGETTANVNTITRMDRLDPISGYPWMRALPVRLQSSPTSTAPS